MQIRFQRDWVLMIAAIEKERRNYRDLLVIKEPPDVGLAFSDSDNAHNDCSYTGPFHSTSCKENVAIVMHYAIQPRTPGVTLCNRVCCN